MTQLLASKERPNGSKLLKIVKEGVFYKIIVWRKLCLLKFRFVVRWPQYIVPLTEEEFWKNMQNSGSYDFLKNSIEMLGSYFLIRFRYIDHPDKRDIYISTPSVASRFPIHFLISFLFRFDVDFVVWMGKVYFDKLWATLSNFAQLWATLINIFKNKQTSCGPRYHKMATNIIFKKWTKL